MHIDHPAQHQDGKAGDPGLFSVQGQRLDKGKDCSGAKTGQGQRLDKGKYCTGATTVLGPRLYKAQAERGQRLYNGNECTMATTVQGQTLYKGKTTGGGGAHSETPACEAGQRQDLYLQINTTHVPAETNHMDRNN
jgi:hypothetical protein